MAESWKDRAPEGVGNVQDTATGFSAEVSIPLTDDGFLGRECPTCGRRFTIDAKHWEKLPNDVVLMCCYCGAKGESSDFATRDQEKRVMAAAKTLGAEMARQLIADTVRGMGRPRRPGSMVSIEVSVPPPGPITQLPEIVEQQARRIVSCPSCGGKYGVVGAIAYCPVCGRRGIADSVADAIAAGRRALTLEDALDQDAREIARAEGVFDRLAADTLKSVVTQFELAVKADFARRVQSAATILRREQGNVFQRLADVERLYRDHAQIELPDVVGADRWERLTIVFQQRHVLIHLDGHVDQQYHHRVPNSGLSLGQRLVITRIEAELALDDLEKGLQSIFSA